LKYKRNKEEFELNK